MNRSGLAWKVGLFVVLSLAVAAGLIMKFSKSTSVLDHTYELLLVTSNVGGIRPGATVLMAGVQVGTVKSIQLDESGKIVTMHVEILSKYQIHADARFTIEQAGFLGDQYISITPQENLKPVLIPHQSVQCMEPFNIQEVARSAGGLIKRVDETAAKLNEAVARLDKTILSEQTLTNFSAAVLNFRVASERALSTLNGIDELVQTNAPPLGMAITNLVQFSEELNDLTKELQVAVTTNRVEITAAVKNLESGTVRINELLADLQKGKGLIGGLLQDEQMKVQFSQTVSNFSVVSSNLSAHGLLWKPPKHRSVSATPAYTGRRP